MTTVSRYYTLAVLSGVLAAVLLVAAVFLRVFALVSGLLVLLLIVAAIYFSTKGVALNSRRRPN